MSEALLAGVGKLVAIACAACIGTIIGGLLVALVISAYLGARLEKMPPTPPRG